MIDKVKIAQSFSRSANTYDSVAYLQRDIGGQLIELIQSTVPDNAGITQCLDLGCGTGFFQDALQTHFSQANHVACDLAVGMLSHIKKNQTKQVQLAAADAENLPFVEDSFDFIFSNLALQWCEDLDAVFAEAYRVLQAGGYFCLSTLGPKTLYELKESWEQVDEHQHVNGFKEDQYWLNAAKAQGFSVEQHRIKPECLYFDTIKQLTYELKQLGAHNMNAGQAKSLTGRQRWHGLQQAYQAFCNARGQFPATYEVYYYCLRKNSAG